MAIKIQMRDGLIEVTYLGKVTADDLQQHLEDLRDLESRLEVTPNRIADLTDATAFELRSSDLVYFAKSRRVAQLKNQVRSAIIAPQPVQHGLARMFLAYNTNPAIEIKIFKDSEAARSWVKHEQK